jgi:hypothetical protein
MAGIAQLTKPHTEASTTMTFIPIPSHPPWIQAWELSCLVLPHEPVESNWS